MSIALTRPHMEVSEAIFAIVRLWEALLWELFASYVTWTWNSAASKVPPSSGFRSTVKFGTLSITPASKETIILVQFYPAWCSNKWQRKRFMIHCIWPTNQFLSFVWIQQRGQYLIKAKFWGQIDTFPNLGLTVVRGLSVNQGANVEFRGRFKWHCLFQIPSGCSLCSAATKQATETSNLRTQAASSSSLRPQLPSSYSSSSTPSKLSPTTPPSASSAP